MDWTIFSWHLPFPIVILKRFRKKDFFITTSFVMKIEFRCFFYFFNLYLSKYFLVLEWTTVIFPPIYIKLNWSIMGYVKGLVAESTRELWKKHKIFLQTFYFMHKYPTYYYLGFLKRNRNTKTLRVSKFSFCLYGSRHNLYEVEV